MASGAYSNTVLVGNWSEERLQNEFFFKLFLRKRDRKELLLQKSRILFSNLLKERPLKMSGAFAMFGYNVQFVATDMAIPGRNIGGEQQYGLALSALVTDKQVDYVDNLNDGCLMTLSPILTPCARNTFIILNNKDHSIEGEKVRYGDEFIIKCVNYEDEAKAPLYVRYTVESAPAPMDRLPIRLSGRLDSNCRWTAYPLYIKDYIELLGSPIKSGEKLIIKNCVADKNLCVMNQSWMKTFFGPECGVTCRNYLDFHKRYTAENIFTFVSDVKTKKKDV